MDDNYLQELIDEVKTRDGGLVLNLDSKPAAVVLSVEKYNQLVQSSEVQHKALKTPHQDFTPKRILVTGGAGFIGTHVVRQLLKENFEVTVLDNLVTGRRENVPQRAVFVQGDVGDINLMRDVFASGSFDSVIHLAGSLEVEESVREPQKYFENNCVNTYNLLKVMNEANCKKIIFSSTAAVYGLQNEYPLRETSPARPNNPYGSSKLLAEQIIKYYGRYMGFQAVIFRYFNACGCDFEGDVPLTHHSHLIPIVLEVAQGVRPNVLVYGADYETMDGTGIRDYVHVLDIARAHVAALNKISEIKNFEVYNIGTGKGLSVKEVIAAASEILNHIIPMEIAPRRPGDSAVSVADNTKLSADLDFSLQHSDIKTIISTTWTQLNKKA